MNEIRFIAGAEPFLYKGGSRGVLLIHGFTGSPAEMRFLGERLHKQGFTVLAIRLPGHGTQVQDMEPTNWHHWYGAVVDGRTLLSALCEEINVVGLSMGGLLALKLAADHPVNSVTALSTPVYLANRKITLLPLYRLFCKYVQKKQRDYDIEPKLFIGYNSTPLSSLASLLDLIHLVRRDVCQVKCPTLLVQSRREHTVRPESASVLYELLSTSRKELFWLEKSGHIVTLDIERELVFAKISDFLSSIVSKE